MNYSIKSSAVSDYENIYKNNIEQTIKRMVNNQFILQKNYCELSMSFYEDFIVTIKIEEDSITELNKYSYEEFIPDSFLAILLEVDNLPPRLSRYKKLGIARFRNEIKESLKHGKIIANNNYAIWRGYKISLKIDQTISFVDIVT